MSSSLASLKSRHRPTDALQTRILLLLLLLLAKRMCHLKRASRTTKYNVPRFCSHRLQQYMNQFTYLLTFQTELINRASRARAWSKKSVSGLFSGDVCSA